MSNHEFRPLLFVAMPFGEKEDRSRSFKINFDLIYNKVIRPAGEDAGLEVIRADEELAHGIIHLSMFERLLLAEVVLADLTLANANVFYEVGVRHAARPRTTILMHSNHENLPFDIHMIRAIPYKLTNGLVSDEEASRLRQVLEANLKRAKEELELADSPLFQMIPQYEGVNFSQELASCFRTRAQHISGLRSRIRKSRDLPRKADASIGLKEVVTELGDLHQAPIEVISELLQSYRDIQDWESMIGLCDILPKVLSQHPVIRQQRALALNRQGRHAEARQVLLDIVNQTGLSSELCGLLGRTFKDEYQAAQAAGDESLADEFLNESIDWYLKGFVHDPRDYYPGINAVTLMFVRGTAKDTEELKRLKPAVSFSVERRGGLESKDYWDAASVLELAALDGDSPLVKRAIARMRLLGAPRMAFETAANNQKFIRDAQIKRGLTTASTDEAISALNEIAAKE